MRAMLAVSMVFLTALAGCVQDAPTKTLGSDEQDPTPTTTGATNSTGPNESVPNAPPTASLAANRTNGSAPLSVTFSLGGDDPDGDDLTWTLDADGDGASDSNGTMLPAELSFLFNETGNYTATLSVTDGNATANATVDVAVEGASAAKEDLWVRWDAEGMCHAKEAVDVGPIWIHDRPGEGAPYGSGLETGGGTWIYEESNDVPGLQVGGGDEDDAYVACANPDTLIF